MYAVSLEFFCENDFYRFWRGGIGERRKLLILHLTTLMIY